MQITSRFTIAVHIITAIDYFQDKATVTSKFLAGSVGANPVIVRNVMGQLKEAGVIISSQGKSGIGLKKDLSEISFYDIYKAVECVDEEGLFHFHEKPNILCPVGRNIHKAMDDKLGRVQEAMEKALAGISLAEVAQAVNRELAEEGCCVYER